MAKAPAVTDSTDAVTDELDWYYQRAHERGPDPAKLRNSQEARAERREASGARTMVSIDDEIVRAYQRLSDPGRDWRSLMRRALRDWLTSRDVLELVRHELGLAPRRSRQPGRRHS